MKNNFWMRVEKDGMPCILHPYPYTICPKCTNIIARFEIRVVPIYKEYERYIEAVDFCGDTYYFHYQNEIKTVGKIIL